MGLAGGVNVVVGMKSEMVESDRVRMAGRCKRGSSRTTALSQIELGAHRPVTCNIDVERQNGRNGVEHLATRNSEDKLESFLHK